jgi:hypothetical protein
MIQHFLQLLESASTLLSSNWMAAVAALLLTSFALLGIWQSRNWFYELYWRCRGSDLIPLLDLRDKAEHYGWDFEAKGSLHILDFIQALNEAGSRGLLRFYGRDHENAGSQIHLKPRVLVSQEQWKNLMVCPDALVYRLKHTVNLHTGLCKRSEKYGDRVYSDIHISYKGTRHWFLRYAREFRGQNEKAKHVDSSQ